MKTVKESWKILPRIWLLISMLLPLFRFTQPASADGPIPGNLVSNGDFASGAAWPWTTSETWPAKVTGAVVNGEYCVTVSSLRQNIWDAQMRHRRLTIEPGHTYTATFTAYAPQTVTIKAKVAQGHYPWGTFKELSVVVTPTRTIHTFSFVGKEMLDTLGDLRIETAAEFSFHIGDNSLKDALPYTICFDDISLVDATYVAPVVPSYLSDIRVNQHGYLVYGPKKASVLSSSTTPLTWQLGQNGVLQASGQTTVSGYDAASGDYLHAIDFSDFHGSGDGFYLGVQGIPNVSYWFSIADNLYGQMKFDALAYFYHNRDEAIDATYVGPLYARGAMLDEEGYPFDYFTPCFSGPAKDGTVWDNCVLSGTPPMFSPNYFKTVSSGWYDAGDHGKYVVNGGIAVWTLMNMYERNLYLGDPAYAFGDGTMNIPDYDSGAGVPYPDILKEALEELAFMRSMQIIDSTADPSMFGLVHHMIHDTAWTDIPNRPDEVVTTADSYARAVYPPSTAATLNWAAVAGQCARLYEPFHPEFAYYCELLGEIAWDAAIAHPDMYAVDRFDGGGPYNDSDVSDEFYWAAAELYIATGKDKYKNFILTDPYSLTVPSVMGGEGSGPMTWKDTRALGTISLAIAPNGLSQSDIIRARANIAAAADAFVANEATQGYGTPYVAGPDGYAWGSNSFILNEMVVMGLAHDFTGDMKYLDGMVAGMDYLLGRNAMDKSYVSGYGENPLQNPHHRHWGYQGWPRDDFRYPPPPPGAISGGPNSTITLEDCKATQAMGMYASCISTPQKCYADDIDAFSVNEVTINWNAPFAWVTAYLDELKWKFEFEDVFAQALVSYTIRRDWRTGATVDVVITNNSDQPIENWSVEWVFPGNQRIYQIWNAGYSQTGTAVRVWNTESWNNVIAPNGGTVSFGFNLTYSGRNAKPAQYVVDGDIPGEGDDGDPVDLTTVVNIVNDWGTGYCANVTVTNNSDEAVDWETTFTMPSPGNIYDFWNVNWSRNGNQVTISGIQWNNILQPGESTHSIGYCANR